LPASGLGCIIREQTVFLVRVHSVPSSLDVAKIKAIVISHWRTGRMNTLLKVMPTTLRPDPARMIGSCISFKYVVGRTPEEMGLLVGLKTKLLSGASIYYIKPLPNAAEFELRGYTQTPGGIATDDPKYVPHPEYPPGMGVPEWHLSRVPQSRLVHLADVPPGSRFKFAAAALPLPL
jgi:hypothetical protein